MNAYEREKFEQVARTLHESEKRMSTWTKAVLYEIEKSEHCRHLIYNMLNHEKLMQAQD